MPRLSFTDQLRRSIIESGCTQAELRKATGLDRGAISRFLSGQLLLREESLNKVAEYVGWQLTVKPRKRKD
jgi:transcriptional regulator with XRE-family HTH domain